MSKLSVFVAAITLAAASAAYGASQNSVDRTALSSLPSITFPSLTTIYVASGVLDSGADANEGNATVVHCSNYSASTAQLRFVFHSDSGVLKGTHSFSLPTGNTYTIATHGVNVFGDVSVNTGPIVQGRLLVRSTESAVFCTAMVVDAAASAPVGIDLHMVRFNAHPKTVE